MATIKYIKKKLEVFAFFVNDIHIFFSNPHMDLHFYTILLLFNNNNHIYINIRVLDAVALFYGF